MEVVVLLCGQQMALTTAGGAVATAGTKVPMGMRVKWYQRAWELYVEIEGPDMERPEVSITDDGQLVMNATVAGTPQVVSLKFLHGVKANECRHDAALHGQRCRRPHAERKCPPFGAGGWSARGASSLSCPSRANRGPTGTA